MAEGVNEPLDFTSMPKFPTVTHVALYSHTGKPLTRREKILEKISGRLLNLSAWVERLAERVDPVEHIQYHWDDYTRSTDGSQEDSSAGQEDRSQEDRPVYRPYHFSKGWDEDGFEEGRDPSEEDGGQVQ